MGKSNRMVVKYQEKKISQKFTDSKLDAIKNKSFVDFRKYDLNHSLASTKSKYISTIFALLGTATLLPFSAKAGTVLGIDNFLKSVLAGGVVVALIASALLV